VGRDWRAAPSSSSSEASGDGTDGPRLHEGFYSFSPPNAHGVGAARHLYLTDSIPWIHIDADEAGGDAGELLAGFVVDNAKEFMRAGQGKVGGPLGGGALEITIGGERLDRAGKVTELFAVQPQDAEDDFANLIGLIGRQRHVTGDVGLGLLAPGSVAMDGRHDGTAGRPISRDEFVHKLDFRKVGRLLDGERAAENKGAEH